MLMSSFNGFGGTMRSVDEDWEASIVTPGFMPLWSHRTFWWKALPLGVIGLAGAGLIGWHYPGDGTIWSWFERMALMGAAWVWVPGFLMTLVMPEVFRWHSCEHKAARVIIEGRPPTHESVRRASPVMIGCGSVHSLLFWGALLTGVFFRQGPWLLAVYPSFVCGLYVLMAVDVSDARWYQWIPVIYGLPALLFCMSLEWLCFLRKPLPRQLDVTVETVVRAFEDEPRLRPDHARGLDVDSRT